MTEKQDKETVGVLEKEFNLSEKVRYCYRICRTKNTRSGSMQKIIKAEDVKEFIKKLKEIYFGMSDTEVKHEIDKLAGDKLI